jgi:hypothetical protein
LKLIKFFSWYLNKKWKDSRPSIRLTIIRIIF